MDSPAETLRQALLDRNLVSNPVNLDVWPMYVSHLPDRRCDDECVIVDTTPVKDGRIVLTGEVVLHCGVQIFTRSQNYEDGWAKDDELKRCVDALHNEVVGVNERQYLILNATKTSSTFLGLDEQRRNTFVANYVVTIRGLD